MARELTNGWVPYFSSSEPGRLRSCLPNPDILLVPPDSIRIAGDSRIAPLSGWRVNRRSFVKYNLATAAAFGANAATARPAEAQILAAAAGSALLGAAIYFLATVANYLAGRTANVVNGIVDESAKALEALARDATSKLWKEILIPAITNLYRGEESQFHWDHQEKEGEHFWYNPQKIQIETKSLASFGQNFGVHNVQWDIGSGSAEFDQMQRREKRVWNDDQERRTCFCLPRDFRRPVKGLDFSTGVFKNVLSRINKSIVDKGNGDHPIQADEIVYWMPLAADGGGGNAPPKNYTGFGVKRAGHEFFVYDKTDRKEK